ncbi:MAG: siderophore-interacting protein [Hahellaceae bacterium]|nr:siderophore-interacting protein [Hahellaceae bacterium]
MTQASTRRSPPRLLRVKHTCMLSPHLKRISLTGKALEDFPEKSEGAHIKIMLPQAHQRVPILPTLGPTGVLWPPDRERPITRTYSVSRYDAADQTLDIDFVLHTAPGPASDWARNARPGDQVGIAGPGGPDRIRPADWYLLVADPSALAALAAALRALPVESKGYALIEVSDESEVLGLEHPDGVSLRWLYRGDQLASHSTLLLDAVKALPWMDGLPSVMVAGENTQVVAIRDYLLQTRNVPRTQLYAVPYWKDQHTEESYHAERHRIMDELEAPRAKDA